ncbi:MAG: 3-keto-5-aminohexanoate cleavage protein [Pseudomonadota bacterium]
MKPTILTCAVTGEGAFNRDHPSFPVTPEQICAAVEEAAAAGASVVHCHVRDPETGEGCHDPVLYAELTERIREKRVDVVLNLTCGGNATFAPDPFDSSHPGPLTDAAGVDVRMRHLEECRPEIASLDVTTMNEDDVVYLNTAPTLREMAKRFRAVNIKPELEVFGPGDLELVKDMIDSGIIDAPPYIQFVLGVKWGMPWNIETIMYMKSQLPEGAEWGMLGIGRRQMPTVALSAILGGNVRVGLEDNLYLEKGVFATNGQLVERACSIVTSIGRRVATPDEAREILNLTK